MAHARRFYPPTLGDIPMHGWSPYSEIHRERIRAHAKHDDNGGSMERKPFDHPIWLAVVTEEVGEVAKVICDNQLNVLDGDYRAMLREELIQVGAMVAAWIDAIDLTEVTDDTQGWNSGTAGSSPTGRLHHNEPAFQDYFPPPPFVEEEKTGFLGVIGPASAPVEEYEDVTVVKDEGNE